MANVPLDRLISTVQTRLPGTTSQGIQYEMFSVLDEFLKESGAWTDTATFNTKVGEDTYRVAVPAGQILRLVRVQNSEKTNVAATMEDIGVVVLNRPASTVDKLSAKLVLTVADPLTRDAYPLIPLQIATRYNGELLDGVLGHMLSQSSKPYTNETLAVYHLKRFRNGIAQVRTAVRKANTEGAQAWNFPQGFAVKRKRP